MKNYVGIDFGACNLKASYCINGQVTAVKLNDSQRLGNQTPNEIYYQKINDQIVKKVGSKASETDDYENTIGQLKTKLQQPTWKKYIPNLGRDVTLSEGMQDIFAHVWKMITSKNSREMQWDVTLTAPVCFSEVQKKRLKAAAAAAGIPVNRIISEPFAALFSQRDLLEGEDESLGLIFDFGGSTLDLSLLRLIPGDELEVEEVAAAGLDYGGLYIDRALYEEVLKVRYAKDVKDILAANPRGEEELLDLVAKMKEDLFDPDGGENEVTDIYVGKKTGKPYEFTITGDDVTQVLENAGIRDKIEGMLDDLLDEAGDDLTWIRPFGGTSLIPYFQNLLRDYAGEDVFDPEDYEFDDMYGAIADGAAQYGKVCDSDSPVQIENSLPYSLGLKLNDTFAPCLERGSLPGFVTPYRSLLQKDLEKCNYVLPVYQCFATAHLFRDPVFIGKVGLEKAEYASYGDLLYKMKNDGQGNIHLLIYRFDDAEKATVLLADKQVEIGDE